jgi:hypothetical protein
MYLDLLDPVPDPLIRGADRDPDHSIIKQKQVVKKRKIYSFCWRLEVL